MLSTPELIVSIHGVGEHEPEQVAKEIAVGLGANASIPVVDFNWCETVEAYERDRIVELSGSIATANSQGGPSSWLTRLPSNAAELIWGYLYLVLAMIPLLFAPTVFLYTVVPEFSLAVSDVPGFLLRALASMLVIAVAATSLLLLLCVAQLLVGRHTTSLWLLRRSLLIVLRPLLALLFWVSSLDDFFKTIGRYGLILIAMNIGAFLFGQAVGWLFGASWDIDHALQFFQIASVVVAGALVGAAILGVLARAFSQPIKFFRDVFNYIGSPSTRERIQNALTKTAADLPGDKHVVLACHSLGSVIAVDSLINSKAWHHVQSIVLITGGSPIRRWFQRFFPGLFFPSDRDRLSDTVARNAPVVAWINVFRQKDPVGSSLNLPRSNHVGEIATTRTDLKGHAAHSHYWRAQDVHDAVKDLWGILAPRSVSTAPVSYEPTTIPPSGVAALLGASQPLALMLAGLAAIVLGISNYFGTIDAQFEANRQFVEEALAHGTRVTAAVTHRQYWRPGTEYSYPVQKYVFRYATTEGDARPEISLTEVEGNLLECCQLFDSVTLLKDLRLGADLDEAHDFAIEVAYLDEVLDKIAVPRYPPTVEKIPWYYDLIMLVLFAIFGVGLCGLLGAAGTLKLLKLLVPYDQDRA